jgi:hypothetical protein
MLLHIRKGKPGIPLWLAKRVRQTFILIALTMLGIAIALISEKEAAARWALACLFSYSVAAGLAGGLVEITKRKGAGQGDLG